MFKRPRLSAQTFPVNAGIASFLLLYAASCSGPQEQADDAVERRAAETVQQPDAEPLPANTLPAVWSTRQLDAPVQSIGIAGGAGSALAVAYEGGGLQIFNFDGERITSATEDDVRALGEGRYAMLSGTPVTVFPGIDDAGELKVWIYGGGASQPLQYDLQGDQVSTASGLCAAPPSSDASALHHLAYWTETEPSVLQLASIRENSGELELVSEGEMQNDRPITACTVNGTTGTAYSEPVQAAASLRRLGRQTTIMSEGDGDLQIALGDNDPATFEVRDGISVKVPSSPSALAATGDARGGGYPGGVVVLAGTLGASDHRVVLIDPSRITMTPIEVPSPTE
jgi:hypothetical protein